MAIDPHKIAEELSQRGMAWADADAAANALEETRKSVIAEAIADQYADDPKVSYAKAETFALASQKVRDHVKAMVDARKAANRARVRWDTYKAWLELIRTQEATKRAEMRL
jgi:hypothetical protein